MGESPLFTIVRGILLCQRRKEYYMSKSIKETVFEIGDAVAGKLGMFLVDASFDKENGEKFLRLYIDKEGGVTLDDCESFSRSFEAEFDKADPIEEAYCLEVNSPGVDRVLKTEREFLHYVGRDVDVKLYSAIDGKKEFSGVLCGYNSGTAVVKTDGADVEIPVSKAVYIKLMFRF